MDNIKQDDNPTIQSDEQKNETFSLRLKIIDLEVYGLNLISGWSVKNQKILGDYIAGVMHDMVMEVNELQFAWQKKTPLKELDMSNHGLQDLIQIAYTAGCLKGESNLTEWTRRSKEIGAMIGGYYKYVYPETDNKKK